MIESVKLNGNLIDEFRDAVNKEDLFRENLTNVNGKNHWNVLCSAMDWVNVSVEGLNEVKFKNSGFGVNFTDTVNLMQYIVLIDVLVESIIQMYRVLEGTNSYRLHKSKVIFNQSKLSDDKYFKHIRAVFSTHPVNLDSLDGVNNLKGEKFFASYVARYGINPTSEPDDFFVMLYSNNPNKDETNYFGIKINQLNDYVTLRYELLKELTKKVNEINTSHDEENKKRMIPTVDNPLEQLAILMTENKKRFGTHGYAGSIIYLKYMMETDVESYEFDDFYNRIFNQYRESLRIGINEIKVGLQKMDVEMFHIKLFGRGYEFQKIYDYLSSGLNPVGKEYFEGLINRGKLPEKLLTINDMIISRLMLDAYLYHLTNESGKDTIRLNEIVELIYPESSIDKGMPTK